MITINIYKLDEKGNDIPNRLLQGFYSRTEKRPIKFRYADYPSQIIYTVFDGHNPFADDFEYIVAKGNSEKGAYFVDRYVEGKEWTEEGRPSDDYRESYLVLNSNYQNLFIIVPIEVNEISMADDALVLDWETRKKLYRIEIIEEPCPRYYIVGFKKNGGFQYEEVLESSYAKAKEQIIKKHGKDITILKIEKKGFSLF